VQTRVYLIRHGAVVGAETRRFIGHLDVPLSPLGEAQMGALARRLSVVELEAVYSSDLQRTRRSAEILAGPHGLAPIAVPDLREFDMGRWDGLTADQIRALDPAGFADWMARVGEFQFPEGENLSRVVDRAWPAFERIVRAHPGRPVMIVAHGGTNRAILCRALGVALERILALGQDYAALSMLEGAGERWTLRLLDRGEPAGR
jgi:broad specificity phosphatase PhoE